MENMQEKQFRAQILSEALPYIQEYNGKIVVIKYGGNAMINQDLKMSVMHDIVLLHEIGHDCLHRREAIQVGGLQEFNIFDMRNQRMEYEANMFAAQIALPDDEILEYIYGGYDVGQIARIMCSDINLVALKVSELNMQGHRFREQEHRSSFLK